MGNKNNVHSEEFMQTMAELMAKAAESPEGLKALAAAIPPPIAQAVERREITALLRTTPHAPPVQTVELQQ